MGNMAVCPCGFATEMSVCQVVGEKSHGQLETMCFTGTRVSLNGFTEFIDNLFLYARLF